MQTVQFQGVTHDTDAMTAGELTSRGVRGSWVRVINGTINQEGKLIGVDLMKPYWYEHPYVVGGVVGLVLGVVSGVIVGRVTKKRR